MDAENMMNIVVESRKRFGKMCIDYEKKSSLIENKILNLQLQTFLNYKIKIKNTVPIISDDEEELEGFPDEVIKVGERFYEVRMRVKGALGVVMQMKEDHVGKRLREPLDAGLILAKIKDSNDQ